MSAKNKERASEDRFGEPASQMALYGKDMAASRRVEPEEEIELAQQLREAMEAVGRLARQVPRSLLDRLREEGLDLTPPLAFSAVQQLRDRLTTVQENDPRRGLGEIVSEIEKQALRAERARNRLVQANLRLVAFVAKRCSTGGLELIDLIQEGNLGLMRAVEGFDPTRGFRFATYAYWWIKQSIDRAVLGKRGLIHVPVHLEEKRRRVRRIVWDLARELGRHPDPEEIAERSELSLELVDRVLSLDRDTEVLRLEPGDAEGVDPLLNLPDDEAASPEHALEYREDLRRVQSMLETLSPREEEVIRLRFGIDRDNSYSLQEVGERVDLSRERVRQIANRALERLRAVGA